MNKSRPSVAKKNPSSDPINDVCPHQHFKCDIIDRNVLSRKQHLNLLCTPKGYRWTIMNADPSRMRNPNGPNNPCKLAKKKPGKTYVQNILAEMWDLITPEMANRMKEMLMAEFGLSEEAALDFICHSRYDTTLVSNSLSRCNVDLRGKDDRPPEGSTIPCSIATQKLCKNEFNIDINPFHIRGFSKALSSKFSEYVAAMIRAKRDSKHRIMAEVILRGLCDLTGEETTLDSPQNRLHKILTTTSDRVALWLSGNMEDDVSERAKRRRREDKELKKKNLARQKELAKRQREKDRINNEKEKNEKRKAQEEAEKEKLANEEKQRKKEERERRHQEMERFREEEKQKHKEEIKKAKEETGAKSKDESEARAKGGTGTRSKGGQAGGDRSKPTGPRPGHNYRPANEQYKNNESKPGSKSQVASRTGASSRNQGKPLTSISNSTVKPTEGRSTAPASGSSTGVSKAPAWESSTGVSPALEEASERHGGNSEVDARGADTENKLNSNPTEGRSKAPDSGSSTGVSMAPASESSTGVLPALEAASERHGGNSEVDPRGPDTETKLNSNQQQPIQELFSGPGKLTPSSRKSSSVDKFVELLSSQGRSDISADTTTQEKSQEKSANTSSPQGGLPSSIRSQGLHAKMIGPQGKLASELSSHSKFGTVSASQDELATTDGRRRKTSTILTVKKTASSIEIRRATYSEAKKKIRAVKRESAGQFLPPKVPFDTNDPKLWAEWADYATRMAEEWAQWIDKTIQDTEDKAILYQSKAKEGETQPEDIEDWNKFVEKTNEDALRWRRHRKSIFDAAKEWKHPDEKM